MNIEAANPKINTTTIKNTDAKSSDKAQDKNKTSFAEELNTLATEVNEEAGVKEEKNEEVDSDANNESIKAEENKDTTKEVSDKTKIAEDDIKNTDPKDKQESANIEEVIDGLKVTLEEINKINLNHTDEKTGESVKDSASLYDKDINNEDNALINNDMNITEPKEQILPQMNLNMNFNSDGQPFAAFVNDKNENKISSSKADLEEENAILSTMNENLAMANKNLVKTVSNNEGVKKVDSKTNITLETVVKYDNVIMTKDDVEFFTQLVENGSVEMDSKADLKSAQVSKTLADLIAKSMQDNKPVRIDFDNNISVIIKISRDGKITADFLPSSQVAEAYLKENLPILKQRFDENNIEYDSLNQRKQKQEDKNNQKKERKHE